MKWKPIAGCSAIAILAFSGVIAYVDGPGAKVVDGLSAEAFFAIVGAVGLAVLLGLFELIFRVLDGPFPKLPAGVRTLKIYRRPVYKWMAIVAGVMVAMAGVVHIASASRRENLLLATDLAGVFSCIALWYFHYRARRYDLGRTALESNPWFHWTYTAAQMEAWDAGPGAETWIGPDGLMFAGEYAPWTLTVYQLVKVEAPNDLPSRLDFTFKKTAFGDDSSLESIHVPIPEGHAEDLKVIDRQLRVVCPTAKIHII